MLVTASSADGGRGRLARCGSLRTGLCILSKQWEGGGVSGYHCEVSHHGGTHAQSSAEVLSSMDFGGLGG